MRQVRLKISMLHGTAWKAAGEVIEVEDDFRAAKLVELGHAEYVAAVAVAVPVHATPPAPQKATAPKAPENAKGGPEKATK